MTTYYTNVDSPLAPLLLVSDGASLTGLFMCDQQHRPPVGANWVEDAAATPFAEAREQLNAYFRGERTQFGVPLAPRGTGFQQTVWAELRRIPFGETVAYCEIARGIGSPGAARAVGLANGRNPIGIIVPCHRVVGARGVLTGYAGGLARKEALLAFEQSVKARGSHAFAMPEAGLLAEAG